MLEHRDFILPILSRKILVGIYQKINLPENATRNETMNHEMSDELHSTIDYLKSIEDFADGESQKILSNLKRRHKGTWNSFSMQIVSSNYLPKEHKYILSLVYGIKELYAQSKAKVNKHRFKRI